MESSSDFISRNIDRFNGTLASANDGHLTDIEQIYSSSENGFSRLFRCKLFGRLHVLKALQPQYMGTDFYETALYKEFSIGFQLEHPHICRTINFKSLEGLGNCILMEYIDGITLSQFIEQGRLTQELAFRFVREICSALEYMHSKQIVHRDIKPANIMVTHNGNHIKLIDFSLSDCDDFDLLKIPAGTKHYIAPEVLIPGEKLDLRADIYSLGVLMMEMASFIGSRKMAYAARRCINRSKEKRPDSAAAVVRLLDARIPLFRRRHFMAGAAAAVALALALTGWIIFTGDNGPYSLDPADAVFAPQSNISYPQTCLEILHSAKECVTPDSTAVLSQLDEAMRQEYPLERQQSSQMYRNIWSALESEVRNICR